MQYGSLTGTTCVPTRSWTRSWTGCIALVALAVLPAVCAARAPSVKECVEASDFIRNAALARDGGMSEPHFLARMQEDIAVLQSLPPQLRWFVQDEEDAEFLLSAATDVFRSPKEAQAHQADFLRACLGKNRDQPLYRI